MRQCIGGNGADTTLAVATYLAGTTTPLIRHLYLIGRPEDPSAIWLTDHEGPVVYQPWGTFYPAVVSKGTITTKAGLDVQSTTVSWSPGNQAFTVNASTATPLQLARLHYYDNWPVRIWKCFMPTPGDANTLGACEWFGGRVANTAFGRNQIQFTINSFLDIVTQKVPANVIESTSTLAGYTAATIPSGDASVPTFLTFTGSTTNIILADCTSPVADFIYSAGKFAAGYLVFLAGTGATLAGVWSAIGENGIYIDGSMNHHSSFQIYSALPWAPTPGVDKFYVSMAAPINQGDATTVYGFPYVPSPDTAV